MDGIDDAVAVRSPLVIFAGDIGSDHASKVIGMKRVVSGEFELPVSAAEAIRFFTPEGERAWVPGWNPLYPAGEASEASGTVFTTDSDGVETIWVVQKINRNGYSSTYSRVTPGHHAGTVKVRCVDQADGGCGVTVAYDMSLLPGSDPTGLDAYNDPSFAAMMDEWASEVSRALSL